MLFRSIVWKEDRREGEVRRAQGPRAKSRPGPAVCEKRGRSSVLSTGCFSFACDRTSVSGRICALMWGEKSMMPCDRGSGAWGAWRGRCRAVCWLGSVGDVWEEAGSGVCEVTSALRAYGFSNNTSLKKTVVHLQSQQVIAKPFGK